MDLRLYLRMLRRQRWLIILTAVVVAVAAGAFATIQKPVYTSTTQVLLRPSDPTEELPNSTDATPSDTDLARYVAGQALIVTSLPVAEAAATQLAHVKGAPTETAVKLQKRVSVQQSQTSNVIGISATGSTPAEAQAVANAFANAYIANVKDFDVSRLQDAVTAVQSKLTAVQATINSLSASGAGSTQANAATQAALTAATTEYANLLSQQQTLQVEMQLKHGEAQIISPAELPTGPSSPHRVKDVALGFFVGLFLGAALGFVREQMDSRVNSDEDAEELTGLPLLGQIPIDAATRGNESHLIMRDQSTSAAAEAIRALRTAVQLRHSRLDGDRPLVPRIVVTSPGPGEGKTLVAANLAAAFAEAGQRTLLVSADLRNPQVERLFNLARRSPGLGDYVRDSGSIAVASVMVSTDVRNLFLLKAGAAVSNPAGVFTSESFDTLLGYATRNVDVVVFDTPPVLAVTDATVIAARADEVLLVVAENDTSRSSARRARSILQAPGAAAAIGLVVNKVPASSSSFDSYYRPVAR